MLHAPAAATTGGPLQVAWCAVCGFAATLHCRDELPTLTPSKLLLRLLQVCRLPWLKQSIRDWLQQHGRQLPAEASCCLADIEGVQHHARALCCVACTIPSAVPVQQLACKHPVMQLCCNICPITLCWQLPDSSNTVLAHRLSNACKHEWRQALSTVADNTTFSATRQ